MKKLFLMFVCSAHLFSTYSQAFQIAHIQYTFTDPARSNRQIACEIYYQAESAGNNQPIASGSFPLLVFGHGFVMTPAAYQYVWTALVPDGYIMVLPLTESSLSPSHNDFALDMKFVADEIRTNGAGAHIPGSALNQACAIMGHSMGGGCAVLAAQSNSNISALVTFGAANTSPSAIAASSLVSVPALFFSGGNDCVTPPAQHQNIMYDSTLTALKTQVTITGGGHCYFADYNFNCAFGESTCSPAPSITRNSQQQTVINILRPWLTRILRADCSAGQQFQDSLSAGTSITWRQSLSVACAVNVNEEAAYHSSFLLYPNPAESQVSIQGSTIIRKIVIRNAYGLVCGEYRYEGTAAQCAIDISILPIGLYFLQINSGEIVRFLRQ